ncbi:MAG: TolC family protein, partial [Gammaproteobacteria bacterium]|nr:TolC family protein [Gammaproteobacteria bacterium]
LADAWRLALRTDGSVAAARGQRRAADAERSAATRQHWPTLDVGGGYTQLNQAPILDIATPSGQLQSPKIWKHDGYATASADLSLPLWTSGRIKAAIGAASAGARGAAAVEAMTDADVKLAVAAAYVDVFRARRALAVADSALASLKAHADDVDVMYRKQAVAKSDLLAAQVALANATEERLRAANALDIADAAYDRWVGKPLDRVPDLAAPPPAAAADGPVDELVAQAVAHRPELAALDAERSAFEARARAERAQTLPQIALHAGYNHFDNQILDRQNFASVGVTVQWRLFDSGQVRERVSALESRAGAALRQGEDLRSKIALEVRVAVLNRDEAAARLRAAGLAVAEAEENVRVADELYRSGLGTNTQVLEAEALRVTALTNRDTAQYDLLISGYRIERASGEL